jgi:hypothetical protein
MHSRDAFGVGLATELQFEASAGNIGLAAYALGNATDPAALQQAVAWLNDQSETVVILAFAEPAMVAFLLECEAQGLDVSRRVWVSGLPYIPV